MYSKRKWKKNAQKWELIRDIVPRKAHTHTLKTHKKPYDTCYTCILSSPLLIIAELFSSTVSHRTFYNVSSYSMFVYMCAAHNTYVSLKHHIFYFTLLFPISSFKRTWRDTHHFIDNFSQNFLFYAIRNEKKDKKTGKIFFITTMKHYFRLHFYLYKL